jgi:hypothetical protein
MKSSRSRGIPGPPGPPGPPGERGQRGEAGARGERGATGARGERGATGSRGATGARGAKGDRGLQGSTGERGLVGPAGPSDRKIIVAEVTAHIDRIYKELDIQMRRMAQIQAELDELRAKIRALDQLPPLPEPRGEKSGIRQ